MPMMKHCWHCGRLYEMGTGVRSRCGDCGRAYDRELSRKKRARRARNSARWQKARALAKQRDGGRCVSCGATDKLEVHHIVRVADGGDAFALSNLRTLCIRCHGDQHRGREGATGAGPSHPPTSFSRKKLPSPRPRFSRNRLTNVSDDEGPLIG
jgi:HNH endonuclease